MLSDKQLDLIEEKTNNASYHKNAFNCSKCPKEGCPAYWNFKWLLYNKESKVHAEKQLVGCGFSLLPILITDILSNSYQNLDSLDRVKNQVSKDSNSVKLGMIGLLKLAGTKMSSTQLTQLGKGNSNNSLQEGDL